jgi:hypothetical protein
VLTDWHEKIDEARSHADGSAHPTMDMIHCAHCWGAFLVANESDAAFMFIKSIEARFPKGKTVDVYSHDNCPFKPSRGARCYALASDFIYYAYLCARFEKLLLTRLSKLTAVLEGRTLNQPCLEGDTKGKGKKWWDPSDKEIVL